MGGSFCLPESEKMNVFLNLDKAFSEAKLRIIADKFIFLFKKQTQVLDVQKISVSKSKCSKAKVIRQQQMQQRLFNRTQMFFLGLASLPTFHFDR